MWMGVLVGDGHICGSRKLLVVWRNVYILSMISRELVFTT